MEIKFRPWSVPSFLVVAENDMMTFPVCDVPASDLASLCDQFRADVFKAAGKEDPAVNKEDAETYWLGRTLELERRIRELEAERDGREKPIAEGNAAVTQHWIGDVCYSEIWFPIDLPIGTRVRVEVFKEGE